MKKDNHNTKTKLIICILIILIIILLLITSCTSIFYGRIGNPYDKESSYEIGDNSDKIHYYDTSLKFIKESNTITMNDNGYKIKFKIKDIKPKQFTCTTSDAKKATCMVKDSYVEVYPKKTGKVTIYVQANANGAVYVGRHYLTIKKGNNGIKLATTSGTISLENGNLLNVPYELKGIKGTPKIKIDNEKIANAYVEDGILVIEGKKPGSTNITLSLKYKGKKYSKTFTLSVEDTIYDTPVNVQPNTKPSEKPSENKEDKKEVKLTGISVSKKPNKTSYTIGQNLNVEGLEILATYSDGSTKVIKDTSVLKISPTNLTSRGDQTVTVSYKGLDTTFIVKVNEAKPSLRNIMVEPPTKTSYLKGERLDLTGMVITAIYSDGTTKRITDNFSTSPSANSVLNSKGTKTVTVTYQTKKATFNVLVTEKLVADVEIINMPRTLEFSKGSNINTNGLKLKVTYDDGSSENITSGFNVTPQILNNVGTQTITISYGGQSVTYDVNVLDTNTKLNGITVKDQDDITQSLSPAFRKEVRSYTVNVGTSTTSVSVAIDKAASQTITYEVIDKTGSSSVTTTPSDLDNLVLNNPGTYEVNIKVEAEDGTSETYKVTIVKSKSTNNKLSNLEVISGNATLSPAFTDGRTNYNIVVDPDVNTIDLKATLADSKSSIKYLVDGVEKPNLNNIPTTTNTVRIEVKSESGKVLPYIINISKKQRLIEFINTSKVISVEDGGASGEYNIAYKTYEMLNGTKTEVNMPDSEVSAITYKVYDEDGNVISADVDIHKDYITYRPDIAALGKTYKIELTYNGSTTDIAVTFNTKNDYKLSVETDKYNILKDAPEVIDDLIFSTNIFSGTIAVNDIYDGISLSETDSNFIPKDAYLEITSSDTDIVEIVSDSLDNQTSDTYYSVKYKVKDIGTADITLTAYIYGEEIASKTVTINVETEYEVILDANEGFFNALEDKYVYSKKDGETIDLSEFDPHKEAVDCKYYTLKEWNTASDGTGTSVSKTEVLEIHDDITLYAIYDETNNLIEGLPEDGFLYLADVDVFKNDEYYKKHGIEKMIYPGLEGKHKTTLKNTTDSAIIIKKFYFEEDNLCVDIGCVNMGYRLVQNMPDPTPNIVLFGESGYNVLYDKNNIKTQNVKTQDVSIRLEPNEEIELEILWKWVDDNVVDTKIGNSVTSSNYEYTFRFYLKYEKENKYCP